MLALLAKIPSIVVVCMTVVLVTVLASLTILIGLGRPTTDINHYVNTVLTAGGFLTGSGALLFASSAAQSSKEASEQTNGQLEVRVRKIVAEEVAAHNQAQTQVLTQTVNEAKANGTI